MVTQRFSYNIIWCTHGIHINRLLCVCVLEVLMGRYTQTLDSQKKKKIISLRPQRDTIYALKYFVIIIIATMYHRLLITMIIILWLWLWLLLLLIYVRACGEQSDGAMHGRPHMFVSRPTTVKVIFSPTISIRNPFLLWP